MLTNNDIKKIIIIAALIILWPKISDFIFPTNKKKEEGDPEIDDIPIPELDISRVCENVIYEPLSLAGFHGSNFLPRGYCLTGDSFFDDKPHSTGDPFADEQAEKYESGKKSESEIANMSSVAIILNNTTDEEITADILDTSDNEDVFSPTTTPVGPDAPVATSATDIDESSFSANWNASTGATGYYLDVATDSGFTSFVSGFENKDVGDVQTYSVTGLSDGVDYYYRVRAYDDSGTGSSSNTITLETLTIYDDWFVPSQDELREMHDELHAQGIGGFGAAEFWSSTEVNATNAIQINFVTGIAASNSKFGGAGFRYRACRSFVSSDVYALRDRGPANGFIFIVIDNGNGTYTYYEAEPTQATSGNSWVGLSLQSTLIGATGTAIGTGTTNSATVLAYPSAESKAIFRKCNDLIIIR